MSNYPQKTVEEVLVDSLNLTQARVTGMRELNLCLKGEKKLRFGEIE